uniref:C-type lectin domain family 6 member A-like n=1 Tax=Crassostrea virginica TaxID=6565 RepID=A0A8B8EUL4_CRAVI|nr:C-type lectin domain family 6 member A-like [Crassostrea virginica]
MYRMSSRCGVCFMLLSLVRFAESQTLYSAIRDEEGPELQALKTTVKDLKEELRVIQEALPQKHSCPPNWYSFGSSCYLVNPNPKSHEDAALSCIMHGSKLVEIETQQENSFLKTILNPGEYWTGGTDSVS